ncbi:MAG: TSUP family transporter [Spirochaetota bacterium]
MRYHQGKNRGNILDILTSSLDSWLALAIAALCIGLDKGGLKPLAVVSMFVLTTAFGAKAALAFIAPIMVAGDIFPIIHYRKAIDYPAVKGFLPWALAGLVIGGVIGSRLNDEAFKPIIGILILLMAVIIIIQELDLFPYRSLQHYSVTTALGITTGFSSIIGNAAGGIASVYFIAQGTAKKAFIGSISLFFGVLNLIKLIVFILFWSILTVDTLLVSLLMVPGILLGTLLATLLVRVLPERVFRIIIIISICYSGIALLFF